eukprot:RCo029680
MLRGALREVRGAHPTRSTHGAKRKNVTHGTTREPPPRLIVPSTWGRTCFDGVCLQALGPLGVPDSAVGDTVGSGQRPLRLGGGRREHRESRGQWGRGRRSILCQGSVPSNMGVLVAELAGLSVGRGFPVPASLAVGQVEAAATTVERRAVLPCGGAEAPVLSCVDQGGNGSRAGAGAWAGAGAGQDGAGSADVNRGKGLLGLRDQDKADGAGLPRHRVALHLGGEVEVVRHPTHHDLGLHLPLAHRRAHGVLDPIVKSMPLLVVQHQLHVILVALTKHSGLTLQLRHGGLAVDIGSIPRLEAELLHHLHVNHGMQLLPDVDPHLVLAALHRRPNGALGVGVVEVSAVLVVDPLELVARGLTWKGNGGGSPDGLRQLAARDRLQPEVPAQRVALVLVKERRNGLWPRVRVAILRGLQADHGDVCERGPHALNVQDHVAVPRLHKSEVGVRPSEVAAQLLRRAVRDHLLSPEDVVVLAEVPLQERLHGVEVSSVVQDAVPGQEAHLALQAPGYSGGRGVAAKLRVELLSKRGPHAEAAPLFQEAVLVPVPLGHLCGAQLLVRLPQADSKSLTAASRPKRVGLHNNHDTLCASGLHPIRYAGVIGVQRGLPLAVAGGRRGPHALARGKGGDGP